MIGFVSRRLLSLFVTLIIVSVVVFIMMHSIPGGPFSLGKMPLPEEVKEKLKAQYGLDKPLVIQYFNYVKSVFTLKFGRSYQNPGETVLELIGRTFPVSALLGGIGLIIAFPLGLGLGLISAVNRNSFIDYITTTVSIYGISVPRYVTSMLLMLIFAIWLPILPTGGWGSWQHLILPSIAYATMPTGMIARYTRSSILEALNKPYTKTARAKGVPEWRIILKHALRNAAVPLLTISLPLVSGFLTGSIFIEKIFRVPGLGKFFVTSIFNRDYPVIMTLLLMMALMLGVTFLITDVLYAVVDPRVRLD